MKYKIRVLRTKDKKQYYLYDIRRYKSHIPPSIFRLWNETWHQRKYATINSLKQSRLILINLNHRTIQTTKDRHIQCVI